MGSSKASTDGWWGYRAFNGASNCLYCPAEARCRLVPTHPSLRSRRVVVSRIQLSKLNDVNLITIDFKMALVGKKSYPKATLKKIIKAHSNLNIKKNADVTVRSRRVDKVTNTH